jgi:hypothetical protein
VVCDAASSECSGHSADKHHTDNNLFHTYRQSEGFADEVQHCGDDAHIEAVENAAQASDKRNA